MSTVGIIAEFNPFHNGHRYLIDEAKRITGADTCIVVMSGDFVQRGTPAICDKYLRSRMALSEGVDAVFELPTAYATASAEIFAEAGIKLLYTLGCVDYVVFGSECGNIDKLMQIAAVTADEPQKYKEVLSSKLKEGLSFPNAREAAFAAVSGDSELVSLLKTPNNILGIEYCKALIRMNADDLPVPVTVSRIGSAYGEVQASDSAYPSATAIRNVIENNSSSFGSELNAGISQVTSQILREGAGNYLPITANDLSDMLYIRLATVSEEYLYNIMDLNRDLINSLISYKNTPSSFTEMTMRLKSKNNTYAALSRALLHVVLDIRTDFIDSLKDSSTLPYARLLGFRTQNSSVLRTISDKLGHRLITKLADADRSNILLQTDIRAAECYNQILKTKFGHEVPSEYAAGVVRI